MKIRVEITQQQRRAWRLVDGFLDEIALCGGLGAVLEMGELYRYIRDSRLSSQTPDGMDRRWGWDTWLHSSPGRRNWHIRPSCTPRERRRRKISLF